MAKFSLATDESFKDRSGEQQKHTEWHNIVAWNKLAEICGQYLTKGKQIYIEGSIRSRQWQDQSGNKRTSYEIIAQRMQMLGSRADSERAAGATAGQSPEASAVEDAERSRSAATESRRFPKGGQMLQAGRSSAELAPEPRR